SESGFGCYGFAQGHEKSIGFDAYEKQIFALGQQHHFASIKQVCPSDVVGCLLDTKRRSFKFYLNGQEVEQSQWGNESLELAEKYYPTVSLSAYQQVYFNFGQDAFRYPPPE